MNRIIEHTFTFIFNLAILATGVIAFTLLGLGLAGLAQMF